MKIDDKLIQLCDQDIRSGKPQQALKRLLKLNIVRVERPWRLPLAKICRRAGGNSIGLALLDPVVHSPFKMADPPEPSELAEYAVLLLRSGAMSEAAEKLEQVDVVRAPEALLYRSYGLFLDWEFEAAIPVLEKYTQTPLEAYPLLVGKMNLAFALIESRRHEKALALTEEILIATQSGGHRQLEGTCRAIRGQIHIQNRDFKAARIELEKAHALYALAESNDHFLVNKLNLILAGLELKSPKPFNELRQLAIRAHDWEAHREADLFSLVVDFSRERFVHLYFGSPFRGFRDRMQIELRSVPTQSCYVLGRKTAPRFDLRTGRVDDVSVLNAGKKIHQLLQVMLKDYYRPLRIGGLFSELFPGERFNIATSPDRVHQLLRRARADLKKANLPLEIAEADKYYGLKITGNISFRIPLNMSLAGSAESQIEGLRQAHGEKAHFTVKDVQNILNVSETTALRLVKDGLTSGQIEKVGQNKRAALYKISPRVAAIKHAG